MRVVLSGAAGFVGRHLREALDQRGMDVIGIDDYSTSQPLPGEQIIRHTVGVGELPHIDAPVDWVMHLASPAAPRDYQSQPLHTMVTGSEGTRRMLDLAQSKQATFLLASTSEVYGDPEVHPQPEYYHGNVNPVGPRSMYDEAKRYAEALTTVYSSEVDTRIARIFNTYGPGMRPDGRLVPTFVKQALEGRDLTVHGSGKQTRTLCYVADLVRGLIALMERGNADPVNLGGQTETTVLYLAETIRELAGTDSSIAYLPRPVDDPERRKPDLTRAMGLLNWAPVVSLGDGLEQTIEEARPWYDHSKRHAQA